MRSAGACGLCPRMMLGSFEENWGCWSHCTCSLKLGLPTALSGAFLFLFFFFEYNDATLRYLMTWGTFASSGQNRSCVWWFAFHEGGKKKWRQQPKLFFFFSSLVVYSRFLALLSPFDAPSFFFFFERRYKHPPRQHSFSAEQKSRSIFSLSLSFFFPLRIPSCA